MSQSDFYNDRIRFADHGVISETAADNAKFLATVTAAAGAPVHAVNSPAASGALLVQFDNTNEVQNVCLSQNDKLLYDIDQIVEWGILLKLAQATVDATTQAAFGMIAARNDAIDSIAQQFLFRLIGSTSLVVETDDGVVDRDDIATGKTLGESLIWLTASFAAGKRDVRFFIDGKPVAEGTTFDMSNYSGSLQLMPAQLQKTADTNTDGVIIQELFVRGRNK